jgi:hypothetical protein
MNAMYKPAASHFFPEDGGSMFLQSAGNHLTKPHSIISQKTGNHNSTTLFHDILPEYEFVDIHPHILTIEGQSDTSSSGFILRFISI